MAVSMFQNNDISSSRVLHTPTNFALENLFYLQETGQLTAQKNHISERKGLESYLFFIVLDGCGRITTGGKSYDVKSGDCVLIDCTKPYSHKSTDEKWSLRWVHFYSKNMPAIYEKFTSRGGEPCFNSVNFLKYNKLMQDIYAIATSESPVRDMKINEKLAGILSCIMEDCFLKAENNTLSAPSRDLTDVKAYIKENYAKKLTLDGIAEKFFINKFYLARLFKEQFGMTIVSYITLIRITQAKQLLRFSDMPIENIAYDVGFADANYFSRIFKRTEGVSPGEFRKTWIK